MKVTIYLRGGETITCDSPDPESMRITLRHCLLTHRKVSGKPVMLELKSVSPEGECDFYCELLAEEIAGYTFWDGPSRDEKLMQKQKELLQEVYEPKEPWQDDD